MSEKLCVNCGASLGEAEVCPKCGKTKPLEAYNHSIRPAEQGGGLLLYRGEEPRAKINESKKALGKLADEIGVPFETLNAALLKAKATPKVRPEKSERQEKPLSYEIVTETINRLSPDSGVVDGRAYLGVWLPCKTRDPETNIETIRQVFHIVWSDGEIQQADPRSLSESGLYLTLDPIYQPPRIHVKTILGLAELISNPQETYQKVKGEFEKYIEFKDPRLYTLLTIWVIGTYLYKRFAAFPYLQLNAVKRAGKTKLLTIISLLAYNSIFSMNMSASALFRLIQSNGATVLMDETEDLNDPERRGDIRSMILGGYKRGGFVYRSEKGENDKLIPTPFEVYGPKAVANIKGLESVLEDRFIPVIMVRGKNHEIVNREVPFESPEWERLRSELVCLYLRHYAEIEKNYLELGEVSVDSGVCVGLGEARLEKINIISSRDWELWRPLLAISYYYFNLGDPSGATLTPQTAPTTPLDDILGLALESVEERKTDNATDTADSLIIHALLQLVDKDAWYSVRSILAKIGTLQEEEQPEWQNSKWLGRSLKRLDFKKKRRVGRGMEYNLTPEEVLDLAERMGVDAPEQAKQPEEDPEEPKMEVKPEEENLQENLAKLLEVANRLKQSRGGEFTKDLFCEVVSSTLFWTSSHFEDLFNAAVRDGVIFPTSPGFFSVGGSLS